MTTNPHDKNSADIMHRRVYCQSTKLIRAELQSIIVMNDNILN